MDDETKARFDAIDASMKAQGHLTVKLSELVERRLDAIVIRLDEQDASHDRLMTKVDRLSVLARAGEDAMTSIDAPSRRVAKLEAALRDRP